MLGLIADTLYLVPVSTSGSSGRAETETAKEALVRPKPHPQVTLPVRCSSVISACWTS